MLQVRDNALDFERGVVSSPTYQLRRMKAAKTIGRLHRLYGYGHQNIPTHAFTGFIANPGRCD
jgi:hypothetical protein